MMCSGYQDSNLDDVLCLNPQTASWVDGAQLLEFWIFKVILIDFKSAREKVGVLVARPILFVWKENNLTWIDIRG